MSKSGTVMNPLRWPGFTGDWWTPCPPTLVRPRTARTMYMTPQIFSVLCPSARSRITMPQVIGTSPTCSLPLSGASDTIGISSTKSQATSMGNWPPELPPQAILGLDASDVSSLSSPSKSSPKRPPSMPNRTIRVKYPFCDCWSQPLRSVWSSQKGSVGCRASRGSGWKNLVCGGSLATKSRCIVTAWRSSAVLASTLSPIRSSWSRVKYHSFATFSCERYSSMDENFRTLKPVATIRSSYIFGRASSAGATRSTSTFLYSLSPSTLEWTVRPWKRSPSRAMWMEEVSQPFCSRKLNSSRNSWEGCS
mmetsp:Transcript_43578/g.123317  ORF Transcript_43578/g.123317 Transcript_43578/m.123317 type:complete len:307 (+) Transcript_43578:423-1343(+)